MKEFMMMQTQETQLLVLGTPIKNTGDGIADPSLVQAQAELGRSCLVEVDYAATHGTCGDERERIGLLNGSQAIEARPSVFGGPDVFGLAIRELTGGFPEEDTSSAEERLRSTKRLLNAGGVKSGGHVECKANAALTTWVGVIADSPEAVKPYAQQEIGAEYSEEIMDEVVAHAQALIASGRYDNWDESVLLRVLGDEAGEAIERLADVPHEGLVVEKNEEPNTTINQSRVYAESVLGKGVFNVDVHYADTIENIVTTGPDAVRAKLLARHAREASIAAVAGVVPNTLLFEATIKPAQ